MSNRAQYQIAGTDVWLSHETLEITVMKAFKDFRRLNGWFVRLVGEADLIQHGWMRVLMKMKEGFIPDYPTTYLYRVVLLQLMALRNARMQKNKFEIADHLIVKEQRPCGHAFEAATDNYRTERGGILYYAAIAEHFEAVDNTESAYLTQEISLAVDRVIEKLAGEYPKCAVGAQLLREEIVSLNRKEAVHTIATQTGYTRNYLWSCRRTLISKVREVMQ